MTAESRHLWRRMSLSVVVLLFAYYYSKDFTAVSNVLQEATNALQYVVSKDSIELQRNTAQSANSTDSKTRIIHFNEIEYSLELKKATVPFSNVSTAAFFPFRFYSGYRNQGMVFTGFVLRSIELNHSQLLLPSLRWKDLYGTNRGVYHKLLFDVVHWNSFYPALPRLVEYDPTVHTHLSPDMKWTIDQPLLNAAKPFAYPKIQTMSWNYFRHYTRSLKDNPTTQRHPAEILMLQGAFRPHPAIQEIIDQFIDSISNRGGSDDSYLALHARVEPDMQKHPVCRDVKVIRLQEIFDMLELTFTEPPASKILIMLGRNLLEKEVTNPPGGGEPNEVAIENLRVLNEAIAHGLWNGRVPVFEAGTSVLHNSSYAEFAPSIGGGIVNYFLAINADIFVGTEVSTFSTDLQTTRFIRGNKKNYKYRPEGLVLSTPENMTVLPRFAC